MSSSTCWFLRLSAGGWLSPRRRGAETRRSEPRTRGRKRHGGRPRLELLMDRNLLVLLAGRPHRTRRFARRRHEASGCAACRLLTGARRPWCRFAPGHTDPSHRD
jgi:hypothetical protein